MISVSINLFRDIFHVSMKTVRIQTAQDVEMIQHPRETWYGNILWIPYVQIPLHRITDSASNGSVFPVVTEHFSASSDHAFL